MRIEMITRIGERRRGRGSSHGGSVSVRVPNLYVRRKTTTASLDARWPNGSASAAQQENVRRDERKKRSTSGLAQLGYYRGADGLDSA